MPLNDSNKFCRPFLFITLLLFFSTITIASNPSEVVVIANLNSTESVQLARFYSEQRSIPQNNVIYLSTPTNEEIDHETFIDSIWNPLRRELLKRNLMEGSLSKHKDEHSRFEYIPTAMSFRYLVTCKGVPLKIKNKRLPESKYKGIRKIFQTTRASVDSELCLIATSNKEIVSSVTNPFFQVQNPSKLDYTNGISVSRLDGQTLDSAKNIVISSIKAEQNPFIQGRVYIDQYPKYNHGNQWLKQAYDQLAQFGYECDLETTAHHWSLSDRCDQPAIYLGWYKNSASGPAVSKTISIPQGAIAAHIHSYSSASILSGKSWVSKLIENGFAVMFGNVYEPYLELTTRPDLFIQSLLAGKSIGDAILFSNQVFSWQTVTIADPLYTPFKNLIDWSLLEEKLKSGTINEYAATVVLNKTSEANPELAKEQSIQYFIENPNIPIAFKILTEFSEITSPAIIRSLIEYLLSIENPETEFIPLYFDLIEKKVLRYSEIITIKTRFGSQKHDWPQELQEKYISVFDNQ